MKLAATSAPTPPFFLFQLLCLILYGSLKKSETEEEEETFHKSSRSYDEESANSSYANNSHGSFRASPPLIGVSGNAAFVSH